MNTIASLKQENDILQAWDEQNHDELLSLFPHVRDWWFAHQNRPPPPLQSPEFQMSFLARALKAPGFHRCKIWTQAVKQISDLNGHFLEHILVTDAFANTLRTSLTDIYGKLAEAALDSGEGSQAFAALKILADKTELAAFRFLSAFTAFNMNNFDSCIAECELVAEPFAPIHTLLGQALLESGNPGDAIDALKVASSIAPNDPLPRVQLIKAYLVTGVQIEAMRQVDQCRKILGHHIEVECLAAMSIMAGPVRHDEFNRRTLSALVRHMEFHPDDLECFAMAIDLSTALNELDWARKFTGLLELGRDNNPQRLAVIVAEILKKTGERQWHDLSRQIIDKTIPTARLWSEATTQ